MRDIRAIVAEGGDKRMIDLCTTAQEIACKGQAPADPTIPGSRFGSDDLDSSIFFRRSQRTLHLRL